MSSSSRPSAPDVAGYYDRNTWRFLRFGGSGARGTIHRALWGPGVTNEREAAGYIHGWMEQTLASMAPAPLRQVIDLGCGVGATLMDLATALPGTAFHGVTLSPTQVRLGRERIRHAGLEDRCAIEEGDFHSLALGLRAEAAFAIEALAHATDLEAVLRGVAGHLVPGGLFVVVDDFLARPRGELSRQERRTLGTFERGWHLGHLGTADELVALACSTGFEAVAREDLSPMIRHGRPRDRLVASVAPLLRGLSPRRFPYAGNLAGGHALQVGLRAGWIRYEAVILRHREDASRI